MASFITTNNLSLDLPFAQGSLGEDLQNLLSAQVTNMTILDKAIAGVVTPAVDSQVIDMQGNRTAYLRFSTDGCISSITGMVAGLAATFIFMSTASAGITTNNGIRLASKFNPGQGSTITFVWNGTQYFEISRSINV